jgi:hypothetical protein
MGEQNIHAICKICPGEFTGCEMDKPDCWIVQGSFALDQIKSLEAERDQFKEAFKKQALYSGELESRLAEAETSLKIANEGLFTSNKITDDQGKRLTEVGNIVNSTYENEVEVVRAMCHNYMKEPLYEEKLQEVVLFHLKNFKTSLEAALCGGDVRVNIKDKKESIFYDAGCYLGCLIFLAVAGWLFTIISVYGVNHNFNDIISSPVSNVLIPVLFASLCILFTIWIFKNMEIIEKNYKKLEDMVKNET